MPAWLIYLAVVLIATPLFYGILHVMLTCTKRRAKPEGVRIERADGTVLPVELVYVGRQKGCDLWEVAGAVLRPGDSIACRTWPPGCGIVGTLGLGGIDDA